jgi:nucleoside-diphosphate-sugar epimerase
VFTAGAGGDTGWDKTLLIDLWGARRSIDACVDRGIDHFVMIRSIQASDPLAAPDEIRPYLVAKRSADDYLRSSALDATILRPTALTDDEGTGQVSVASDHRGEGGDDIPRADVAQTVVVCLDTAATTGEIHRLFGGETPIERAIYPNK